MIWEHDHHCDHAEDIVIECAEELADGLRTGITSDSDYESEEEITR